MSDRIADFFAFARERHAIYLRRRQLEADGKVGWAVGVLTQDPILQTYRFTNVFRELDRTTVWFREHVRDTMRDQPEVLLATVVFRWFNRITTGEAIFSQLGLSMSGGSIWDKYNDDEWLDAVKSAILNYCGSGPYVTGAYIIKTPDGYSKLDGVLQCIRWFMEQEHIVSGGSNLVPHETSKLGWSQVAQDFIKMRDAGEKHRGTLQGMWEWLRKFPFLGDFMAYEIVTDLRHTALLDRAPDIMTWANPGPGATRGIGRVFHNDKDRYNQHRDKNSVLIPSMRILLDASRNAGYWPQPERMLAGEKHLPERVPADPMQHNLGWPQWEMREVEHTLCEFDKYERVRTGEGRPRGRFR